MKTTDPEVGQRVADFLSWYGIIRTSLAFVATRTLGEDSTERGEVSLAAADHSIEMAILGMTQASSPRKSERNRR